MRNNTKLTVLPLALSKRTNDFFQEVILKKFSAIFSEIIELFTPFHRRKVVIFGESPLGNKLTHFFTSGKAFGYTFKGTFDADYQKQSNFQGELKTFKEFCIQHEIDEIFFTRGASERNLINELSEFADQNFIYFRIATDAKPDSDVNTYYFDDVPVISVRKEPLASQFNQGLKRAFDIVFALCVY